MLANKHGSSGMNGTSLISRREYFAREIIIKGQIIRSMVNFWRAFGGKQLAMSIGSILDIGPIIFGGTEKIIAFLRRNGLLRTIMTCARYSLKIFIIQCTLAL